MVFIGAQGIWGLECRVMQGFSCSEFRVLGLGFWGSRVLNFGV